MKLVRCLAGLVMLLMFLTSCGSAGGDKVGSLSVEATSVPGGVGVYIVTATATYTHPTLTNLVGLDISFQVFDTSGTVLSSFSDRTNTSGSIGFTFPLPQLPASQGYFVTATTGDLQDTASFIIPGSIITPSPTSLTFTSAQAIGTTQTITVSGGTPPYTASSTDSTLASVSVSGSTITVTRQSAATGTVDINISDLAGSTATVPVTLQ